MLSNKVETLDTEKKEEQLVWDEDSGNKNFEWSFKPIIWWMRLWGIRLDLSRKTKPVFRASMMALAILMLSVNASINGYSLYSTIDILLGKKDRQIEKGIDREASPAALVNIGMEQSFFISFLLGDHLIFFIVSLTTWKKLWAYLVQIEEKLKLPEKFYRKCRISGIIGLIILALDAGCYFYLSTTSIYWKIDHMEVPAMILGNLSHLSAMSVLTVYGTVVTAVAYVFQVLNHRLEIISSPNYPSEKLSYELETWRLHHDVVCRTVEQLNWSFGLILLLTISTGFVFFISHSYQLIFAIFGKKYDQQLIFTITLVQLCWRLFIVIYVAYLLQSKAALLTKTLRRMRSIFQHQTLLILNTVIVQVSQANSRLSAMDFFDVNLTLFPTLIGTTLTYLVIMCQS